MYRMMNNWGAWGWNWDSPGLPFIWPGIFFIVALDLVLRGVALYRSARKQQKVWFVFLLIINSAGILPLIYLLLNRTPKSGRK